MKTARLTQCEMVVKDEDSWEVPEMIDAAFEIETVVSNNNQSVSFLEQELWAKVVLLDDKTEVLITRVDTWKEGEVHKPVNDVQRTVLQRIKEVYDGCHVQHIPSLKNKSE